MPLDPDSNPDGNVWIDHYEQGEAIVMVAASPGRVPPSIPNRYTSHFTTCPQADEWRKKK
jgi:hypothetical protein